MEAGPMRLPLTGGCQCGAVRYELAAEPLTLYACHCTDCHTQSGSAFALSMVIARDSLSVVQGQPQEWARTAPSGRVASCMYCGDCGTRLFHNPHANVKITILKPGTLDDTTWLDPVGHIWTRSAQPWVAIPAETLNYEVQPPDLSGLIEAWKARSS
jgi:hypothetical protein